MSAQVGPAEAGQVELELELALVAAALRARERAHAPYSGFRVGAAVVDEAGRVFTGCNVEVSSYSLTCCAERVAVFKALSEGAGRLVACAVVSETTPPVGPCGACRQVLLDFGPDMIVLTANPEGEQRRFLLRELLPEAFEPADVLRVLWARARG